MGILDFFRKKKRSNVVIKPVLKVNADAETEINITAKKKAGRKPTRRKTRKRPVRRAKLKISARRTTRKKKR